MSKFGNVIPYGKHKIDESDIDAVVDVLSNRFLTQGDMVPEFEAAISSYCGSNFCTAVNSGTSGLHVACLAAGVEAGDIVWTTPNSFVASANCALYCGAQIDFVDIDPVTRNISIECLAEKLEKAQRAGRLPKAIVVVHFAGLSCDMKPIREMTQDKGIILIEDAAHGLGGSYLGEKIGSCQFSDLTVMSFHPVKSITTAEGGAVLTNAQALQERLQLFSKHGVTRSHELLQNKQNGPWYYEQQELGYNYRLSDLHAALGVSQLKRLDGFIARRRLKAQTYLKQLVNLPLTLPIEVDYASSAWHLFMVELEHHDRQIIFDGLLARGIGVNVHYIPIHLHPFYKKLGFSEGDFPNAEAFYQKALTIPLFPDLSADEQNKVIHALTEVLH